MHSNQTFFKTLVDASYDIVDTTVNEAIKTYLKGVTDTVSSHLFLMNEGEKIAEITKLAKELRIGESGYIYLLSPQGTHLYHPFLQGQDRSQQRHIQQQLAGSEAMTQYYHANPHEKGVRAKVAYSVKLPSGNTLVATTYKDELMYLVNLESLKEKLRKYSYGESGYIYIVDLNGDLVLHPNFENKPLRELIGSSSDLLLNKIREEKEGHFSYDFIGSGEVGTKNIFYKFYPYLDWVIAAGISDDELNKNHNFLLASLFTMVFSLMSIIVVLVLYLKNRHLEMLEAASLDYLTGLHSRRSFMEKLKLKALALQRHRIQSVGVVLLDIDHFKSVNDQFGHVQGDKVICAVAKILQQFESEHCFVARYGGEEFILVIWGCSKDQLYELSENIRKQVERIQGLCREVTISAGCYRQVLKSSREYEQANIEMVIEKADKALYLAKESGRNNSQFYVSSHRSSDA